MIDYVPAAAKPGHLRSGPGIDPEKPYYMTFDGPVQGPSPKSKEAESLEWSGNDLDPSELTGDDDLPEALKD